MDAAGAPRPSNSTGSWLATPRRLSARLRSLTRRMMFHSSCAPRLNDVDA